MTTKYENFSDLTFYQIYPRSFRDTDGDGMGDIRGITEKIPYLRDLGIDAVWISPFYKSPMSDGGYDISDYRAIDELFGDMTDFREMLAAMHEAGIKVIVDFVPNHTSTEHFWFQESRKSKKSPYRDFYIWADEPLNDWVSACCDSAWKYDELAGQYYLHCFNPTQADLNWDNPRVRREMCAVLDYWVDMGVDGFRCDVIDMISEDWENNRMNKGPHLHEYINELFGREKMAHVFTVGECWGANVQNICNLTAADRGELTTVFQFEHINRNCTERFAPKDFTLSEFGDVFTKWQNITQENDLIYTLFMENHDVGRCISRFANDKELRYESATMFATMLYGMRGIPFIYQGQEIGATNSYFTSIEDFDDMESLAFYNTNKDVLPESELWRLINFGSRDNARRPMAWDSSKNGGFSTGDKTWLTLHPDHKTINVETDKASEKSVYRYFKDIIALRKANAVLRRGTFESLTGDAKNCFMYRREYEGEEMIVVCNYEKESRIELPANLSRVLGNYPEHKDNVFAPFEAAIYKVIK